VGAPLITGPVFFRHHYVRDPIFLINFRKPDRTSSENSGNFRKVFQNFQHSARTFPEMSGRIISCSTPDPSTLLSKTSPSLYMTTQVRASHILVTSEDDANKILKRIKDGEDFAAVAKRFSSCPSRKNAGDLGWFGKGQMVPEFEAAVFAAEQG